jgi:hypothetical protein
VVDLLGKKCRKLALVTEAEHRILAAMIIMADSKKLLVHVKNYSKWKSFCFQRLSFPTQFLLLLTLRHITFRNVKKPKNKVTTVNCGGLTWKKMS